MLTGATGFIGGRTARTLIRRGHKLRLLVRDSDQAQEFFLTVAEHANLPPPSRDAPEWLIHFLFRLKRACNRFHLPFPLPLTSARYRFLTLNQSFSIDKAQSVLRYSPDRSFDEDIAEAVAWAIRKQVQEKVQ